MGGDPPARLYRAVGVHRPCWTFLFSRRYSCKLLIRSLLLRFSGCPRHSCYRRRLILCFFTPLGFLKDCLCKFPLNGEIPGFSGYFYSDLSRLFQIFLTAPPKNFSGTNGCYASIYGPKSRTATITKNAINNASECSCTKGIPLVKIKMKTNRMTRASKALTNGFLINLLSFIAFSRRSTAWQNSGGIWPLFLAGWDFVFLAVCLNLSVKCVGLKLLLLFVGRKRDNATYVFWFFQSCPIYY
jgi:hypothetical protein